ncbi:hypothetical protein HMPREF0044_0853 [Gleimia coleocanis DSM 15436]|uniref:DoxX family protein n=1 Tax=Gleimia coleocanis DSM 15436 TaxID=525245 RepID=C0VZX5_9ACTO|nr:hypothetical protein [Gleimia coleocanis]EEH63834.1 hypothetical protein HMPREF0044_0853 [Gleimia coleocanis DSM 15436]
MSILRTVIRPVLVLPLVVDSVDAIRNPKDHAKKFLKLYKHAEKHGAPKLSEKQAKLASQAAGCATLVAAAGFISGKAPRTCATMLALTALPVAIVQNPVWTAEDRKERNQYRRGLERYGAVFAGLVFAAFDRQGEPSVAWKAQNWRDQKVALVEARNEGWQAAKDSFSA